jgi:hypothetical protein
MQCSCLSVLHQGCGSNPNGKASSSCAAHPKHKTLGYFARSQLLYLARLPLKTPGGCELLINRTFLQHIIFEYQLIGRHK